MSEIKVDTIGPRVDNGTLTIGASGDTVNIAGTAGTGFPAGVSLSGSTNNTVATVTGANALIGEANLTFDGSTLTVKPGSNVHQLKLEQNNATDYWSLHADSSGGPLSFQRYTGGAETEKMRIDTSGNVGIGTTSPDTSSYFGRILHIAGSSNAGIMFNRTDSTAAKWSVGCNSAANLDFVKEGAVKMRINNEGELLLGVTSPITGEAILQVKGIGNQNVSAFQVGGDGQVAIRFFNSSGSGVGGINANTSSTTYNTSSDYRLKENEVVISDGIERLKQLKPYKFNFKTEPDTKVDGFFAHEVSDVVPEAISGTKDAMHPEVLYADAVLYTVEDELPEGMNIGDIKSSADELPEGKNFGDVKEIAKPNHQGIDQSKLVPLLVAAVQELTAKVEALENA